MADAPTQAPAPKVYPTGRWYGASHFQEGMPWAPRSDGPVTVPKWVAYGADPGTCSCTGKVVGAVLAGGLVGFIAGMFMESKYWEDNIEQKAVYAGLDCKPLRIRR